MRTIAALLLLLGTTFAGPPKAPHCVRTRDEAVEMAKARGMLIFLTVLVDHDSENRAVVEHVFRDSAFLKISKEFVCAYANVDDDHGRVAVKTKSGKRVPRCADCPSIECQNHMQLAQHWARGFYEDVAKTPMHFVINAEEDVVKMIYNGDFKTGMNHVAPKVLVAELKKVLKKHGKGLNEKQYKLLLEDLSDAKAARSRDNTPLELKHLMRVAELPVKTATGVIEAKKRIAEIDTFAQGKFKSAQALLDEEKWEEGLDAMQKLAAEYPGTPTAILAEARRKETLKISKVKKLLKAADIFAKGIKYKENKKLDRAREKFELLLRRYKGTKYAELAQKELDAMGGSG